MDIKLEKVKEILKKYDQEQLLMLYDELDEDKKEKLIKQILNIDFEKIIKLYNNSMINKEVSYDDITPLKHIEKSKLNDDEILHYTKKGETIIKENRLAVVTMAGGQGTRLRI